MKIPVKDSMTSAGQPQTKLFTALLMLVMMSNMLRSLLLVKTSKSAWEMKSLRHLYPRDSSYFTTNRTKPSIPQFKRIKRMAMMKNPLLVD